MVVAAERRAAEIGADILRQGGNAIDAAVAVGFAEAVTNPCCGNLGGGGFLVAHLAATNRDMFIDFRETAPAAATKTMYLDASGEPIKGASLDGCRAVATPGTVLGLDAALKEYGTMNRAKVMAPAIALARDGFVLGRADADIFAGLRAALQRRSRSGEDLPASRTVRRSQPGDRLVQSDLAATLQAIADQGPDAFYRGAIAAEDRRGDARQRRHRHRRRPRRLPHRRGAAARLRLSRLSLRLGPAALLRRRDACARSSTSWKATTSKGSAFIRPQACI